MKTSDLFKLADVVVGIVGIGASIYSAIKCAKITNDQMDKISEMTADKLICKLGLDKPCEENNEEHKWEYCKNDN